MVKQTVVNNQKLKRILTYISHQRHPQQLRMMFLCSWHGMRSINFAYLQVKDVYTTAGTVRDRIRLDGHKNKGQQTCTYYLNHQIRQEFKRYLSYIRQRDTEWNAETYLFISQKQGHPYHRVSISRLFARIYRHFGIQGASHVGRHLFVSRLINAGTNICVVQRLDNHRHITTTQHYFNCNEQMLLRAVEQVRLS